MPQLDGKQIKNTSIVEGKLATAFTGTIIREDGSNPFTGDQSMGNNKLTSVANGIADGDAVNKGQLDAAVEGLDPKDSVVVATVAAGTLTTDFENGDTVDGVVLVTGDRILIKTQASGVENGVYTVNASGAPTRADDFATGAAVAGAFMFVEEGTTNADNGFVCTNNQPNDIVGTDALTFTQFSGAGAITAGAGLTKTGNTLDVGDVNKGVQVNADDVQVDASEIAGDGLQQRSGGGNEHLLDLDLAAAGGLKIVSGEAAVEPNDFAGTGLEDDGSDNLRIAAAAAGAGLAGGAGAALSVNTGDGVEISGDDVQLDLKAGGGLKIDTAELAVEPADFAGAGLEDDGADNLRISAAAAGNGLTGGAGSALAVQNDGDSIAVSASGIKAATPVTQNKDMAANLTSSDNDQGTATTVALAPAGRGYVSVFVNGVKVEVGDGTKVSVESYFSGDAGVNARAFGAIAAADTWHWNGSVAGYELATTDLVDFVYTTA